MSPQNEVAKEQKAVERFQMFAMDPIINPRKLRVAYTLLDNAADLLPQGLLQLLNRFARCRCGIHHEHGWASIDAVIAGQPSAGNAIKLSRICEGINVSRRSGHTGANRIRAERSPGLLRYVAGRFDAIGARWDIFTGATRYQRYSPVRISKSPRFSFHCTS